MPAPTVATYSVATLVGAHTFFRNLLDAGAGAGSIKVRSAADVLLAEVLLTDPCGTVSAGTGQLTLTPAGPDASANASGTAAYAELCDSAGLVHLVLPAQAGSAAVSGFLVANTLDVVAGASYEVLSAVVG